MELADYAERFKTIRLQRDDRGVLTIQLHSRGGSLVWGALTHREMPELLDVIRADSGNSAVILTGTGENFITTPEGYGAVYRSGKVRPADWERGIWEANRMLQGLLDIQIPVIAAVNGPATGHAELAMLCDIVICSDDTYFQDVAHIPNDLVPGDGVQIVWPMVLGPQRARYFLLMSEKIHAAEAKSLGIVSEVLPKADVLGRAHAIAHRLLEIDSLVLRYTRHILSRPARRAIADEINLGLGLEAYVSISRFPQFDEPSDDSTD